MRRHHSDERSDYHMDHVEHSVDRREHSMERSDRSAVCRDRSAERRNKDLEMRERRDRVMERGSGSIDRRDRSMDRRNRSLDRREKLRVTFAREPDAIQSCSSTPVHATRQRSGHRPRPSLTRRSSSENTDQSSFLVLGQYCADTDHTDLTRLHKQNVQ